MEQKTEKAAKKNDAILVRGYVQADLPEMIMIWNEVVTEGVAFPQEEKLGIDTGSAFFSEQDYCGVAYDEETASIVGLYILHPNNIGRCGHICNASYAVDAACRGSGVGAHLVKDCIQTARRLGYRVLQFNAVVENNVKARRLYERLGFCQLGIIPGGFRMADGHYENICPYYLDLTEKDTADETAAEEIREKPAEKMPEPASSENAHEAAAPEIEKETKPEEAETVFVPGVSTHKETKAELEEIRQQTRACVNELLDAAGIGSGQILVVGCSSSEVGAHKIGSFSSAEIGQTIFEEIYREAEARGIYLAAQCCEHLNRCLIVERRLAREAWLEEVNAVPQLKAGGAFATACWNAFRQPAAVKALKADAGIDIGDTLIGMHLKAVAVPVRIKTQRIGNARVICARTRLPYIGGQRTHYM